VRQEGYWIVEKDRYGAIIKCNMCGQTIRLSPMRFLMISETERYCSVCGTKMIGTYEQVKGARTNGKEESKSTAN